MFIFEKRLEFPVVIKNRNPKLASYILSQYGGPDGELAASLRYLSQRFSQTDKRAVAVLTDIGTGASEMLRLHIGTAAADTVNRHFSGRIFK